MYTWTCAYVHVIVLGVMQECLLWLHGGWAHSVFGAFVCEHKGNMIAVVSKSTRTFADLVVFGSGCLGVFGVAVGDCRGWNWM